MLRRWVPTRLLAVLQASRRIPAEKPLGRPSPDRSSNPLLPGTPPGDEKGERQLRTTRMRTALALLATTAITGGFGVGMASPASAHGACRSATERVSGLTATAKVSCTTARKVAAGYDTEVMAGGAFPGGSRVSTRGFSCATTPVGHESEESFSVRCAGRRGVIRFAWGV